MSALTLAEAARTMREAVKDRSYRATPLGLEVARYYRWKKNEWGATKETLRDYESILARTALYFADLELSDLNPPVGTDRLRECWDHHWGDKSARTRAKVRSVWVDFFDWAGRERGMHGNPARPLASPKRRDVKRDPYGNDFVLKVISSQQYLADRLGCVLILECALRRAELAAVRFRDFDFQRRRLIVKGKGGAVRAVPIVDEAFWVDLEVLRLELQAEPDWFLLAPRRKTWHTTFYYHHKGFVARSVHTWWYDRLEEAGFVGDKESGTRRGINMHRGRHTVATDILRKTGNAAAAQKMLGHKSIETTIRSYAQFDDADLARVLLSMREAEKE